VGPARCGTRGGCKIEGRQHPLLALVGRWPGERQEIAGRDGPACKAADTGARVGRAAAEHRLDGKAAFDGQIGDRARERADAQALAALQRAAVQRRDALRGTALVQDIDRGAGSGEGDAHAVGLHRRTGPGRRSPAPPLQPDCRRSGWPRAG
jgi:hypothetical protein